MFTISWDTRRYLIPDYNKSELDSAIKSWARGHTFRIFGTPKFDARKLFWVTGYNIAKSRKALLTKKAIDFVVGYRAPILYVFSTSYLPPDCFGIFEEVFATYSASRGGHWIEETPLNFSSSYLMTSPLSRFESLRVDYSLLVELEPLLERIEGPIEEISVPEGATVSVKRSRTLKHSVEVMRRETEGSEVGASLKIGQLEILQATIKSEIQRQYNLRFEETETLEHTISLSGDHNQNYRLVWADFVRRGIVKIRESGTSTEFPFSCRERTELQVLPV